MESTRKCKTTTRTEGDEHVREHHCVTRTKKLASDSEQPRGKTTKEAKAAAARYALRRAQRAVPAPSDAQEKEREGLVENLERLSKVSGDGPGALKELQKEIARAFREDVVMLARRVKDRPWRAKITSMREALERAQVQMIGLPPEERARVTVQRFKELLAGLVATMREGITLAYGGGAL
jgi:hypothetical protein